jgi:putative ABC transport system ATP-binding protein
VLVLLRQTCKNLDTTVVMVTHDARTVSYADRVVFLKNGQIVRERPVVEGSHSPRAVKDVMSVLEF